jgi:DeoR/GlpR family transcriptional regulator of sugar metabolism
LLVLAEKRRNLVLDAVKQRGFITLTDLAEEIGVSESTVRRDLDHWQRRGVLKRIHGGAMFTEDGTILPAFEARSASQIEEKRVIARAAATRIRDGDAVLLDGGTTTYELARLLVGRPMQIVTNSLPIANLFANSRETDLVILGGYIYPTTGVALGPLTIRMLEDVHVQQTILSVAGITGKGLFNGNPLLVETERQMMRCGDEVVVLVDHTKIGRQSLAFLCELGDVDTLIVDSDLTSQQKQLLGRAGAHRIYAGRPANGVKAKRASS